ncbi:hypothetical protein V5F53_18185 [Xanthobacter sp. V4C-4]|uniref:hypothetical protein n=1 Tax=Xanthobacter cornucopiae TaxID=3119924 RepID=UPI003729B462
MPDAEDANQGVHYHYHFYGYGPGPAAPTGYAPQGTPTQGSPTQGFPPPGFPPQGFPAPGAWPPGFGPQGGPAPAGGPQPGASSPGASSPGAWPPGFPPAGFPFGAEGAASGPAAAAAAGASAPRAGAFNWHQHPAADSLIKGLAVGAGAAYLLTNETAQRTILRTAVQIWSFLQGGVEELKERLHDAEAEVAAATAPVGEGIDPLTPGEVEPAAPLTSGS